MVRLRSGKQTFCEDYDLNYCRNLSLYTPVQLRQLKLSLESNFLSIHHDVENDRQNIELFLLSQWRHYHENIVMISTPDNCNKYMTTFEGIIEHCNIDKCDIDIDFDDEFLCGICGQDTCIGYGFRICGVHSPCYGIEHLRFRTNIDAHEKSVIAKIYLQKNMKNITIKNACF
jgi:hypothetical protein